MINGTLKFCESSWVQQETPEEGWRACYPKCVYNKDKDISMNTLHNISRLIKKFRQMKQNLSSQHQIFFHQSLLLAKWVTAETFHFYSFQKKLLYKFTYS